MREATGDMFSKHPCDAIVISTNGFRKHNGDAVMGRGCAATAAKRWPVLSKLLGNKLETLGNHVHKLIKEESSGKIILSFPVKPASGYPETQQDVEKSVVKHWQNQVKIGGPVPGFACVALPELIERSARELLEITNDHQWEDVVCPRFGCGAGELKWSEIREIVNPILDDRFIAMTF